MRPATFHLDRQEQWSRWVLVHGLPALPGTELDVDQAVPVAYWIGPTTAAVLHVRRYVVEDMGEDDDLLITETDVDLFCRADSGWESRGGGGGGWEDTAPLARYEVPRDYVALSGMN